MTIFVNIASYRDPECEPTVRDLFRKAAHPERIHVGVLLHAKLQDKLVFAHERMRLVRLEPQESRGCCRDRAKGYALYDGEDHVLQIDSHMRFAERWDEKLLDQLAACDSPKPLLTASCAVYEPPDDLQGHDPPFLAAKAFEMDGVVSQHGLLTGSRPPRPKPSALVSGHFLFGSARWIREVPYDPWLYFFGEEITLAVRLWTSGWDLFCPSEVIAWHRFTRGGRRLHWEDAPGWAQMNERAHQRMRHLLGMGEASPEALVDIHKFGLGSARSLEEYQRFSGIDFAQRRLEPHALAGHFGN
jgi:Glycosyltransferase (GlcNAc)